MNQVFHQDFSRQKTVLNSIIANFTASGTQFGEAGRNAIKLFDVEGKTVNVKSFKIPNLINKIAYKYFRKSKARRSFENASFLLKNNIGTPQPVAYFENFDLIGLKDSYYISEHLEADFTFRELVRNAEMPDRDEILRQFTHFSYKLHRHGIEFKDHSPGNTLIVKTSENQYRFYLVDLNRMKFHKTMRFETRMKNLSRLTPHKEMVRIMSEEYAALSGEPFAEVFKTLWSYTENFQKKFHRKKKLKSRLRL